MFPIPQVFCQKEKGHPSVFMDHPNCITPNGKSVFIKLTVRLIKLRSGHVIVDQRIFQVGNPIIYQAYCVPLLYESRTVTPCHPPGCAYR